MDPAQEHPQLGTMRERLNYLFATVRPVGKEKYSVRDVSEAIKTQQGFDISAAYISAICTGRKGNPGILHVEALAKFFGVSPGFLVGSGDVDVAAIAEQLERLREAIRTKELLQEADEAMSDPEVRAVVLKARGLPRSYLGMVNAVLDEAKRQEALKLRNTPQHEEDSDHS